MNNYGNYSVVFNDAMQIGFDTFEAADHYARLNMGCVWNNKTWRAMTDYRPQTIMGREVWDD